MPIIIAYTWDANIYCIRCTRERFPNDGTELDEHGVPVDACDDEGNPIHPKFSTDEVLANIYCDRCKDELATA